MNKQLLEEMHTCTPDYCPFCGSERVTGPGKVSDRVCLDCNMEFRAIELWWALEVGTARDVADLLVMGGLTMNQVEYCPWHGIPHLALSRYGGAFRCPDSQRDLVIISGDAEQRFLAQQD